MRLANLLLLLLLSCFEAGAQPSSWMEPFPAHTIAGNLHYVGSKDLASYLVTTAEGHILINSSFDDSVPLIRKSIEDLGFRFGDIKVLLISHAHSDHCAGSARIIQETGAKYFVMEEDADAVEKGGVAKSRLKASYTQFTPARVDRRLKDGEEVTLGGTTLVARLTPGHSPGCTTWTLKAGGLDAVIIGSPNVNPGYILVNNQDYPGISSDYERCFRVLKSLPVDLFLGAHGGYYDLPAKHRRFLVADGSNPFVDPEGYKRYVEDRETAYLKELARQQKLKAAGQPNR
jgi:metallo-beta-lactamase class B